MEEKKEFQCHICGEKLENIGYNLCEKCSDKEKEYWEFNEKVIPI